jgi:zinc protease
LRRSGPQSIHPYGRRPIEVVVVGDITVDRAIQEVAATFGALPQRQAKLKERPELARVAFPRNGEVSRLKHSGRPDVALGMIFWPTDDFFDDPAEARALNVMESVLRIRTIDRLREELGATYSRSCCGRVRRRWTSSGWSAWGRRVNPSQLERLMQVIEEVAEGLKTAEVQPDELARAREPMLQALSRDRAGNEFWIGRLADRRGTRAG